MKSLITIALMSLSLNTFAAQPAKSDLQFKTCITKVYSSAASSSQPAKDTIKLVSTGVKECRQSIAAIKKQEREAKKAANKAKRIQKLKDQLSKLTSNN